ITRCVGGVAISAKGICAGGPGQWRKLRKADHDIIVHIDADVWEREEDTHLRRGGDAKPRCACAAIAVVTIVCRRVLNAATLDRSLSQPSFDCRIDLPPLNAGVIVDVRSHSADRSSADTHTC